MKDASRHGAVRRPALATLASIGSPRAVAMANQFLDDVWVIESQSRGSSRTPSFFLGRLEGAGEEEVSLSARIVGNVIEVGIAGDESSLLRVDLTRARLDSDGDGIPDLAEKRMRLDPLRADTDEDGLADSLDPAPNAHSRLEETEEGRIRLAVFRQYYMFEREVGRGLAVISDPLEWRGRSELTIFFRGPLDAVGYRVLVRRLGGRWFVAELDVVFVA